MWFRVVGLGLEVWRARGTRCFRMGFLDYVGVRAGVCGWVGVHGRVRGLGAEMVKGECQEGDVGLGTAMSLVKGRRE